MPFIFLIVIAAFAVAIYHAIKKKAAPSCRSRDVLVSAFTSEQAALDAAKQASTAPDYAVAQTLLTVVCEDKPVYLLAWIRPSSAWSAVTKAAVQVRYVSGAQETIDVVAVDEAEAGVRMIQWHPREEGAAYIKFVIDEQGGCHKESPEAQVIAVGKAGAVLRAQVTPTSKTLPTEFNYAYEWYTNGALGTADIDVNVTVNFVKQVLLSGSGGSLWDGEWEVTHTDLKGVIYSANLSAAAPDYPECQLAGSWLFIPLDRPANPVDAESWWDRNRKVTFELHVHC